MGYTAHDINNPHWRLWVRHAEDMCLKNHQTGEEIQLLGPLIKGIVAEHVRNKRISALEQMDDDEVLGLEERK